MWGREAIPSRTLPPPPLEISVSDCHCPSSSVPITKLAIAPNCDGKILAIRTVPLESIANELSQPSWLGEAITKVEVDPFGRMTMCKGPSAG